MTHAPGIERLPDVTLERSRAMEQMAQAAALLGGEYDVAPIASAIVEQALGYGAIAAHLLLVESERRVLRLAAERNIPPDLVPRLACLPFDAPLLAARAALTREPQYLADADLHRPGFELAAELAIRTGARSITSWPLIVRGQLLGVLTWLWQEPQPSRAQAMGTEAVCKLFAVGLQHAVTHSAEVRGRERAEALHDAVLSLGDARTPPELLARIAAAARTIAQASTAGVALVGEDGMFAPFVIETEKRSVTAQGVRPQGLLATLLAAREPIRIDDLSETVGSLSIAGQQLEIGAFLGLPFGRCAGSRGFLFVGREVRDESFMEEELRALTQLLEHASTVCERIRLDTELRLSEERFRLSIDNAPIGMALVGLDGRFLRVNQCLCEIVGYPPEELMQLRFQDITHPDDLEADLQLADKLWKGEIPRYTLDKRYFHRDGHVVYIKLHGSAVRSADGRPLHAIAQIEDVTEQKRAEQERLDLLARIEAERKLLETVLENVPVAIALVRPDGGWALVNGALRRLVGDSVEAGKGSRSLLGRLLDDDGRPLEAHELPSRRVFAGELVDDEEYLLRRSGEIVAIRVKAAPLPGPSGDTTGAVIVAEDIETAKQLERLRQEWTSVVAHDLRQPISVIKLHAALGCCHGGECRRMQDIRRSATRLERMVSDLLDFAQVEAHRLRIDPTTVKLAALVRDSVETTGAHVRRGTISLHVADEIPPVWADPERLEQILANLLSNAVKYRRPDTPIRVELGRQGDVAVVSVINEGEGIAADEIDRLFDRFHRTQSARGRAPGLGLGLYITRGLVEAHGGRIWVESALGQTTAFRFSLPLSSPTA
jgi:PAS domain S-box-containing protein